MGLTADAGTSRNAREAKFRLKRAFATLPQRSMSRHQISIVVPVYGSAEILPELIAKIDSVIRPTQDSVELILVNDASRDGSWDAIRTAAAEHPWVRGFDLLRNFGQHNAILCGVRAARYPMIVTMDDDLQHPPEEVATLLAKLDEGYDVVYGTPAQQQHGLWRDATSVITKGALRAAMGVDFASDVSAFRAFRTQLRDGFVGCVAPNVSMDVLLSWATTRFAAVKVRHLPRARGASNYTFGKLVRHALTLVTGFSTMPLRVATFIGFFFTLFGIAVLAWVLIQFVRLGSPVAGFPFLASVIAIFSGAQLFALGVIGEYVGRIHFQAMGRPTYAVRDTTDRTEHSQ